MIDPSLSAIGVKNIQAHTSHYPAQASSHHQRHQSQRQADELDFSNGLTQRRGREIQDQGGE